MYDPYAHEVVAVPSVSAGSFPSVTVPGSQEWRIEGVSFVLDTSGVAGARLVRLEYLNGNYETFFTAAAPFTVAANGLTRFSFGIGMQQFGANNAANIGGPLPNFRLPPGHGVLWNGDNFDVGDQFSGAFLFVRQYVVQDRG